VQHDLNFISGATFLLLSLGGEGALATPSQCLATPLGNAEQFLQWSQKFIERIAKLHQTALTVHHPDMAT